METQKPPRTGNSEENFDMLLGKFESIIAGGAKSDLVRNKLLALKEECKSLVLNLRQEQAITARCDNYIAGVYGRSYGVNQKVK